MCSALCFLDTNAVLREAWLGLDNGGGGGGKAAVQEFRMTYPILYFQPTSTEGSEETDNKNPSPKDSYCQKNQNHAEERDRDSEADGDWI